MAREGGMCSRAGTEAEDPALRENRGRERQTKLDGFELASGELLLLVKLKLERRLEFDSLVPKQLEDTE